MSNGLIHHQVPYQQVAILENPRIRQYRQKKSKFLKINLEFWTKVTKICCIQTVISFKITKFRFETTVIIKKFFEKKFVLQNTLKILLLQLQYPINIYLTLFQKFYCFNLTLFHKLTNKSVLLKLWKFFISMASLYHSII